MSFSSHPQPSHTYLALGDSYTIGESVHEPERWSNQLTHLLRSRGIILSNPDIIARTGWTTSELSDAIKNSGNTKKYSMVSLLIGVNNQYRGESVEKFREEFRLLLNTAVSFADGKKNHVFVVSIPDWGVTPFAASSDREKISNQINAFNETASSECVAAGIQFIDITPLSRTAYNNPALVASDGLHFSGQMYATWAELILPVARQILK